MLADLENRQTLVLTAARPQTIKQLLMDDLWYLLYLTTLYVIQPISHHVNV